MYCPCSTAAIVTDTGQWYRCTADITAPLSPPVLQEDGQWVVGSVLEGAALEDKRVYQQMLSKWRRTVDQGVIHQLEEVCSSLSVCV